MQGDDDCEEFGGTSNLLEDLEESASANQVKVSCKVHKSKEQWLLLLTTLLLQLTEGEDHIHCGPPGSEATP